jgi:hypothetical protein
MMVTILSKDTIVTLHHLHPLPSNHVLPFVFYYQLEYTFVLDRTLFAQALVIISHLSFDGLHGMVYEHLLGYFIPKSHP